MAGLFRIGLLASAGTTAVDGVATLNLRLAGGDEESATGQEVEGVHLDDKGLVGVVHGAVSGGFPLEEPAA